MKRIPIFKAGRHTPMSGASLDFSEDTLRAAVSAYDPSLHEAPIVVGHPQDNHPAYGWVKSLEFDEGTGEIVAIPAQVDPAFSEMVDAGRFKKRSASWYLPDSPNNPKPGTLYLRHVGFLGAQPPAVKGLKPVEFSDAGEGVVEFSDYTSRWAFSSMASIARSIREWLIVEKDLETADKVVPNYLISDLENAAKADDPPAAAPAFSEEDDMKTLQELQAEVARLTAENSTLKTQASAVANFSEREAALTIREAAVAAIEAKAARAAVEARVDALVQSGRLLAAQKGPVVEFAMGLQTGTASIDFSEGDKVEKLDQREHYLRQLERAPKVVDYSERSGDSGAGHGQGAPDVAEAEAKIMGQVLSGRA